MTPATLTRRDLQITTFYRPAWAVTNLHRTGSGEIVIRQGGQLVERRRFALPRCVCGELMDCGDLLCADCECRR